MPFCPDCGTKVTEDTRFCHECGHPLPIEQTTNSANVADACALQLLTFSVHFVNNATKDLESLLDVQERLQLPKVRVELLFFCWFALDYWMWDLFDRTQEEQLAIKEALSYHWREIAGGGHNGEAILYTFQERLNAYAQIVNENKGNNAKFLDFGKKLSEFCGMPGASLLFSLLAAELFTKVMESVYVVCISRR